MTKRHGWMNLHGVGLVKTMDLVATIRKFRGRLTFGQIVAALGMPDTRMNWLTVLGLCRRYAITTADPDDPDYFHRTIMADQKKLQEADELELKQTRRETAIALADAFRRAEIARAVNERHTAPRYKPRGGLQW